MKDIHSIIDTNGVLLTAFEKWDKSSLFKFCPILPPLFEKTPT